MKKINVFILFFIALFLIFTCSAPSENLSSSSKGSSDSSNVTNNFVVFTTPKDHFWLVPSNIVGNLTVTLVAGGGGGGTGDLGGNGGGGGGAGQRIVGLNIEVKALDFFNITIGNGGGSENPGGNSQITNITQNTTYTALGGSGANGTNAGSQYYSGSNGNYNSGGSGGNNNGGCGSGGICDHSSNGGWNGGSGTNAPTNSGGGGGGGGYNYGSGIDETFAGGAGGSGYVRIEYTVLE